MTVPANDNRTDTPFRCGCTFGIGPDGRLVPVERHRCPLHREDVVVRRFEWPLLVTVAHEGFVS